jgi:phage gp36-like protein
MTTPVASGTLYASVADLRNVMSGTDSGTGTAAQLTDAQLELALYSASNRVSVFAGNVYDSSTPQATPPAILHDLTLDLACFWAAKTYGKYKVIEPQSPIYIAYANAMQMLNAVRTGDILLDVAPAPEMGVNEGGAVINRIPNIFTGANSNTRLDPRTGTLEPDVPLGQWAPMGMNWADSGGPLYQG